MEEKDMIATAGATFDSEAQSGIFTTPKRYRNYETMDKAELFVQTPRNRSCRDGEEFVCGVDGYGDMQHSYLVARYLAGSDQVEFVELAAGMIPGKAETGKLLGVYDLESKAIRLAAGAEVHEHSIRALVEMLEAVGENRCYFRRSLEPLEKPSEEELEEKYNKVVPVQVNVPRSESAEFTRLLKDKGIWIYHIVGKNDTMIYTIDDKFAGYAFYGLKDPRSFADMINLNNDDKDFCAKVIDSDGELYVQISNRIPARERPEVNKDPEVFYGKEVWQDILKWRDTLNTIGGDDDDN